MHLKMIWKKKCLKTNLTEMGTGNNNGLIRKVFLSAFTSTLGTWRTEASKRWNQRFSKCVSFRELNFSAHKAFKCVKKTACAQVTNKTSRKIQCDVNCQDILNYHLT